MNTAHAAPTAIGNIYIDEQLHEAESTVAQTTSQLELVRELAEQARVAADEATRARAVAYETLALATCACGVAIDSVDVANADEAQCVAKLNAEDKDKIAVAKTPDGKWRANATRVGHQHPRKCRPRP
jgi:formamidopyrimidine-DNA glycosylase